MPGTASAFVAEPPTITIAGDGLSFTITSTSLSATFYPSVTYCDGTTAELPPIALDPQRDNTSQTVFLGKPISQVVAQLPPNGIYMKFMASRNCEAATPLFMMWLLTRGDQGCILLSETHPSIERQKALCFPATDPDWVADNAPCADFVYDNVYDNDTWSCDAFGFARLPLHDENGPDLWEVWQRHAARQEE
jgi:hypothetical protein